MPGTSPAAASSRSPAAAETSAAPASPMSASPCFTVCYRNVLIVACVALLAGIGCVVLAGEGRYRNLFEEPRIAAHIARGHGFRTPLMESAEAPYTSWCAPMYPYIMGGVYRVLGVKTPASLNVMLAVNVISLAAAAAGACVACTWLFGRAAGLISGIIVAAHPIFLLRTSFYWDSLLGIAAFAWVLVFALSIRRRGPTLGRLALLGVALGLLALINAAYTFTYPVLVLLAAWSMPTLSKRLNGIALAAITFALLILPWTIRNYRTFGHLFYIRDDVNMQLWLGNQPEMYGWYIPTKDLLVNKPERELSLKLGETEFFNLCGERFKTFYRDAPEQFWWRTYNRLWYVFFGDPKERAAVTNLIQHGDWAIDKILLNGSLCVLALAGAWSLWRMRFGLASWYLLLMAFLAGVPFLPTYVSYRYAIPTRFLLVLLAGGLLGAVWHRVRYGKWPSAEHPC